MEVSGQQSADILSTLRVWTTNLLSLALAAIILFARIVRFILGFAATCQAGMYQNYCIDCYVYVRLDVRVYKVRCTCMLGYMYV